MESLKELFQKIPYVPVAVAFLIWLGYDFYFNFFTSPQSELSVKNNQFQESVKQIKENEMKLKKAEEFKAQLVSKQAELQNLNRNLSEMQANLRETIDVGNIVNMLSKEAKRLNLRITSIRPGVEKQEDLYASLPISIEFSGVFVQVVALFDRIARLSEILKVGDFSVDVSGNADDRFVELKGKMTVNAYRYVRAPAPLPTTPAVPAKPEQSSLNSSPILWGSR